MLFLYILEVIALCLSISQENKIRCWVVILNKWSKAVSKAHSFSKKLEVIKLYNNTKSNSLQLKLTKHIQGLLYKLIF